MSDDFFDDSGTDTDGPAFDLRELVLFGVGRMRWVVLGCVGLGTLGGLVAGFSQPNLYRSRGKLLYVPGMQETQSADDFFLEGDTAPVRTGVADELQLLDNPAVHERVAKKVGVERLLSPPDPTLFDSPGTFAPMRWIHAAQKSWYWSGAAVQSERFDPEHPEAIRLAARAAAGAIQMYNERNTNYILLQSIATSPKLATDVCAAYLAESRAWHQEFFGRFGDSTMIEHELEGVIERSRGAQRRYNEHRLSCGNADIATQKAALQEEILDLQGRIAELEAEIAGVGVELGIVEDQLETTDLTVVSTIPAVTRSNPEYERIRLRIEALEQDRLALSEEYPTTSSAYQQREAVLRSQIDDLRDDLAGLDAEIVEIEARDDVVENPRYLELSNDLVDLERERERKVVELDHERERLVVVSDNLDRVLECEPIHDELERDIARARGNEERLRSAFEQVQTQQMLQSEENMQSLRVVQGASDEPNKVGPSRMKMFLGGTFAGGVLGVGVAILRQLLDGRLRYPRGTEKSLGLPVLGVVGESANWKRLSRS